MYQTHTRNVYRIHGDTIQDNFSCTKPNDKSENSMKLVIIGRSCLISGVILTHNLYNLKIELVVMMKKMKQKINEKGSWEGSTDS